MKELQKESELGFVNVCMLTIVKKKKAPESIFSVNVSYEDMMRS